MCVYIVYAYNTATFKKTQGTNENIENIDIYSSQYINVAPYIHINVVPYIHTYIQNNI